MPPENNLLLFSVYLIHHSAFTSTSVLSSVQSPWEIESDSPLTLSSFCPEKVDEKASILIIV